MALVTNNCHTFWIMCPSDLLDMHNIKQTTGVDYLIVRTLVKLLDTLHVTNHAATICWGYENTSYVSTEGQVCSCRLSYTGVLRFNTLAMVHDTTDIVMPIVV